jgi:hypothetical protein
MTTAAKHPRGITTAAKHPYGVMLAATTPTWHNDSAPDTLHDATTAATTPTQHDAPNTMHGVMAATIKPNTQHCML